MLSFRVSGALNCLKSLIYGNQNYNYFPFFFYSCGPIFGAGADLLIANNCNTNKDSYSNLPHSYNGENATDTALMGDYNFLVIDYEVFTLSSTK